MFVLMKVFETEEKMLVASLISSKSNLKNAELSIIC